MQEVPREESLTLKEGISEILDEEKTILNEIV